MAWVWSGALPILIGLLAVAFASYTMCKNPDKRTSDYQIGVAALFVGVLGAVCGIVMMGSGMGLSLFASRPSRSGMSGGYGGGYGGMY